MPTDPRDERESPVVGYIGPVPDYWTPDGEQWFARDRFLADPDLRRRCLAWELAEVAEALERTSHEPAFDPIRLAVLEAAAVLGAEADFRAAMRRKRDAD